MSRTTQDCVDTVAFLAQQVVSTQPSIVFHVPDYGLYRRPPLEPTPQRWLHLSHSLPSEMHFGFAFIVMATVAPVYKNGLRCKVAQLLGLFYSIIKGMSVIRVAVKRLRSNYKVIFRGGRDTHFTTELVPHCAPCLLRCTPLPVRVQFVAVRSFLLE